MNVFFMNRAGKRFCFDSTYEKLVQAEEMSDLEPSVRVYLKSEKTDTVRMVVLDNIEFGTVLDAWGVVVPPAGDGQSLALPRS